MNPKLFLLALPLVFFGCEADEDNPTLVGTWIVNNMNEYSGPDCSGTPETTLDSMAALFGDDLTLSWEFTEDEITFNMDAVMTAEYLCSMMGGTLDGDSCGVSFGTMSMNYPVDSLCIMMEGTYSNSSCALSISDTFSYTTNEDEITMTQYAGTDSAEVQTGTWEISDEILTITVSDDSSCTNMTLSK